MIYKHHYCQSKSIWHDACRTSFINDLTAKEWKGSCTGLTKPIKKSRSISRHAGYVYHHIVLTQATRKPTATVCKCFGSV